MGIPAEERYAEEQEKLRRELEGGAADEIHITAPKDPEVDPKVYRDVEPLLFKGFLTVSAEINGVYFVFKSLNQHEFELLRLSGGVRATGELSEKFWDLFLAYGVFMIDGQNILPERERFLPKIAETFAAFPRDAKQRVIRHMSEVNRRATNAVTLTEAYFTESYSRFRWGQLKGLDLTATAVTGVFGTERLGMNWAQLVWRALNYYEDRNDQIEREWENAKFVGSTMAGKGISKIYHQDNERRRKDKEERVARKDRLLRHVVLGESMDDRAQQLNGAVMISARSVDELAEQLEKDLKGEKDWHDQIVEEHEGRIKTQFQARRDQLQELAERHEEMFGPKRITGGYESFQGLSPDEVRFRMERRKQLEAQAAARAMAFPELHDPKVGQFLDKWGVTSSEVTTKVEETDRSTENVVPIIPHTRPKGTPFGRK